MSDPSPSSSRRSFLKFGVACGASSLPQSAVEKDSVLETVLAEVILPKRDKIAYTLEMVKKCLEEPAKAAFEATGIFEFIDGDVEKAIQKTVASHRNDLKELVDLLDRLKLDDNYILYSNFEGVAITVGDVKQTFNKIGEPSDLTRILVESSSDVLSRRSKLHHLLEGLPGNQYDDEGFPCGSSPLKLYYEASDNFELMTSSEMDEILCSAHSDTVGAYRQIYRLILKSAEGVEGALTHLTLSFDPPAGEVSVRDFLKIPNPDIAQTLVENPLEQKLPNLHDLGIDTHNLSKDTSTQQRLVEDLRSFWPSLEIQVTESEVQVHCAEGQVPEMIKSIEDFFGYKAAQTFTYLAPDNSSCTGVLIDINAAYDLLSFSLTPALQLSREPLSFQKLLLLQKITAIDSAQE